MLSLFPTCCGPRQRTRSMGSDGKHRHKKGTAASHNTAAKWASEVKPVAPPVDELETGALTKPEQPRPVGATGRPLPNTTVPVDHILSDVTIPHQPSSPSESPHAEPRQEAPLHSALVTGGAGFLGGFLIKRLRADGVSVTAVVRKDQLARVESLGAKGVVADFADPASYKTLVSAAKGADAVLHCGYKGLDMKGEMGEMRRNNVEGTKQVARAAAEAGVKRLVFVSTEAVHFGTQIIKSDETAPIPTPDQLTHAGGQNSYCVTKRECEAFLTGPDLPKGLEAMIVRPRLIWGSGIGEDYEEKSNHLISSFGAGGALALFGAGSPPTSSCHVLNVCEGIVAAAKRGAPGEAYYLSDGEEMPMTDFIPKLCEAASGRKPRLPMGIIPLWLTSILMRVMDFISSLFRLPLGLNSTVICMLGRPCTINDSKARSQIGYKQAVTVQQGLDGLARARLQATGQ